jgi:TPR repeat protein
MKCWESGDTSGAIAWLEAAATSRGLAKVGLAQLLAFAGPQADAPRGRVLLLEAAERGDTNAQQVLSAWCLDGTGGPVDTVMARRWAKLAADAGNVQCQLAMVQFLTSGEYQVPDFTEARKYAELVAKAGYPDVLTELERLMESLGKA